MPISIHPRAVPLALVMTMVLQPAASGQTPPDPLGPCAPAAGLPTTAECGTLTVPEDRGTPNGRRIPLEVVRLNSSAKAPAPDPVFVFGGGPGQAITTFAPTLATLMGGVLATRDIVLVDQRGTGRSNGFGCDLFEGGNPGVVGFRIAEESIRECLEGFDGDPTHYTTRELAADIDDVRRALGADRINVVGGSYGSWAAMAYAAWYPSHTRTLAGQSIVPPDAAFPAYVASSFERSLQRLANRCQSETECRSAFGDVYRRAHDTARRLPAEGSEALTALEFASVLSTHLYVPQLAARVPELVHLASEGRVHRFRERAALPALGGDLSWGLFLSVTCSEGLPRLTEGDLQRHTEGTLTGPVFVENVARACERWPHRDRGLDPALVARSSVPALFLSGAEDPAAPPSLADAVMNRYPEGRHIVLESQRHTPFQPTCAMTLITAFIEAGRSEDLDLTCTKALGWEAFVLPEAPIPRAADEAEARDPRGTWSGMIRLSAIGGSDLPVTVRIRADGSGLAATLESSAVPVNDPEFAQVASEADGSLVLTKETSGGSISLRGRIEGNRFEGEFVQGSLRAPFTLTRQGA